MSNKVLLKKSSVGAKVPLTTDLDYGELALNYADGKLYFKTSANQIQSIDSSSYIRVTSNTTAAAGRKYIADTTAGTFTITLPASPASGDTVIIADGGSFLTTSLTVARNGNTIEGIADNLTLNISGVSVTLTYDGTTWQVYTQVGAQGGTEVTLGGTQTLTNKSISGTANTLTNIPNSALSNNSVTLNGTTVSLGGTATITAAAGTLTGTTLNSTVVSSSLTSVGTLSSLTVSGAVTLNGNISISTLPGFRVYGSGTTSNLTTTQNTYGALNSNNWTVDFNQGTAGLNSTTGVFTAPVAGLYQVNIVGRNSGYSAGISQLGVTKNGTTGGLVGGTCIMMIEFAPNSTMNHAGASTVVKLSVGDTLALKVLAGQINFDGNDNWSVAFLG